MFEAGRIYKVKVELAPGQSGFGRATILEKTNHQICIQFKTSRESNKVLPKGTRIWFVNDLAQGPFNGLWSATVSGTLLCGGKTAMVLNVPKLEPLEQRRRSPRVPIDVPAHMEKVDGAHPGCQFRTMDLSRSGVAFETTRSVPPHFEPGDLVNIKIESTLGNIEAEARIIRIAKNWLANKTLVGLEFTAMNVKSGAILDKLLILLGARPRNEAALDDDDDQDLLAQKQRKTTGISSWIGGGKMDKPTTKFVKGASVADYELIEDEDDEAQETRSTEEASELSNGKSEDEEN